MSFDALTSLSTTPPALPQVPVKARFTPEEAKKVAEDFEAVFLSQMLEHMFPESAEGSDFFGGKETDDIYRGMMLQEYGKAIAHRGGLGVSAAIERQLLKYQEVQP